MFGWYSHWIDSWETRLATRDTNRVVRPLEWGLDWLDLSEKNGDAWSSLSQYTSSAVVDSTEFFTGAVPTDFALDGRLLRFTSPLRSAATS